MVQTRIAILGAGVSGLAAAVKLAERGHRVTLFEARREAGGRTRSYVDATTGDVLDNGQHLLMGCYTATQEYLAMIGTEKLVARIPLSVKFWEASGVRSFTIDRALPPPMNLISAIMRTTLISFAEKKAAATIGNIIYRDKLPRRIDDMTCAELFAKCEQPEAVIQKLWSPIVVATINARPEQASARLFVNVIREAFFSSRTASNVLMPNVGLSELLVNSAINKLETAGAKILLGTPVRSIERTNEQFNVITNDTNDSFDYVISTTPAPLYPTPYTPSPPVQTSPIVNAYFWLDRAITSSPMHAFIGMTVEWAFPKQSRFSAQRLALTVSAADEIVEKPNEEIVQILWGDLQRTMPAAREAQVLHSQIIKEKRATPLLTPSAQNARPTAETYDKRFILAGDIVQNGLPATIEGAVRNGFRAAALVP
jgi:squalene-associated FAD-dependent desaturase